MYGPTEATIWATLDRVRPNDGVTIGRPIGNYRVYVLDDELRAAPVGLPGELYIGGIGLSSGYHNRPELNARAFIQNPFEDADAPVLYRTGDGARLLSDGRFECLGREDDQVKILGFRVELGEVDVALRRIEGVRDGVALMRETPSGFPVMLAYVVANEEPLPADRMQEMLARTLPHYMIPRDFVWLDRLPLTNNQKVDRLELRRRAIVPHQTANVEPVQPDSLHPKDDLRGWLEECCGRLLGVSGGIPHSASLFRFGFNSILATELEIILRKRFGVTVELSVLAEGPSVERLAELVRARVSNDAIARSGNSDVLRPSKWFAETASEEEPRDATHQEHGTRHDKPGQRTQRLG
jgi:hypothetical protein